MGVEGRSQEKRGGRDWLRIDALYGGAGGSAKDERPLLDLDLPDLDPAQAKVFLQGLRPKRVVG